jgi:tRNA threonylcarbamoyladenosine biosynthesis protein TsaE
MATISFEYTLGNIDSIPAEFWQHAAGYRLITFTGEMGAGKTTFISHLCKYLQVEDAVSSPTFALVNEYAAYIKGREEVIYHIDLYRLKDAAEAVNAGMEDCIDQARRGSAYCFVEWPGKADALLFAPRLDVTIEVTGETERRMTLQIVDR